MDSSVESQITSNEDEQTFLFARELVGGSYYLPMVLKSAIELDLLEILAIAGEGKFLTPNEIAAQMPTKNPGAAVMLDRILRFLASYSVLKCTVRESPVDGTVERLYALAPVCKYLTRNEDGVSLVPLLMSNQDNDLNQGWSYLKDAVLEGGIPFNKAYGMSTYEYCVNDQRLMKLFNKAMLSNSTIIMKKVLETYTGFEGLSSLVDVGGGFGSTLNMIISKYPSIRGINFDLPFVISNAPTFPGVEHVGGDMFASVPRGDAILIKNACHNWNDENCIKILKNCYDALPEKGKVIIIEYFLPEYPDTSLKTKNVISLDVLMSVSSSSGKERTKKEFEALAKSAGYADFRVMGYAYIGVMELLKNA